MSTCKAPTKTGGECANPVKEEGMRCRLHSGAAPKNTGAVSKKAAAPKNASGASKKTAAPKSLSRGTARPKRVVRKTVLPDQPYIRDRIRGQTMSMMSDVFDGDEFFHISGKDILASNAWRTMWTNPRFTVYYDTGDLFDVIRDPSDLGFDGNERPIRAVAWTSGGKVYTKDQAGFKEYMKWFGSLEQIKTFICFEGLGPENSVLLSLFKPGNDYRDISPVWSLFPGPFEKNCLVRSGSRTPLIDTNVNYVFFMNYQEKYMMFDPDNSAPPKFVPYDRNPFVFDITRKQYSTFKTKPIFWSEHSPDGKISFVSSLDGIQPLKSVYDHLTDYTGGDFMADALSIIGFEKIPASDIRFLGDLFKKLLARHSFANTIDEKWVAMDGFLFLLFVPELEELDKSVHWITKNSPR